MLYLNPFSKIACPEEFYFLLPFAKICENGVMNWELGQKIFEMLGLDWSWIKN